MLFEEWSKYLFNIIYNKIGDDIFELGICSNKNFNWEFFENNNYNWNYEQMSYNPNITVDIVNNYYYKNWNKDLLSYNFGRNSKYFFENNYHNKYRISLELYETFDNIKYYENKYNYKINYNLLSENKNITWEIINENKDKSWSYENLLKYNKNINLDIILNNKIFFNKECMNNISLNNNITWNDICNYPEIKWNFYDLSCNPNINIDIVLNNLDKKWSFKKLSYNPNITLDIIKKYNNFDWDICNYCRNINFNLKDLENIELPNDYFNRRQIIKHICLNNYDKDREEYCINNNIYFDNDLNNINMFDLCFI
jgi:hypothetical protein